MPRRHPYVHLLATTWEFAAEQRAKFVLVTAMFVVANVILMAEPFVLGQLLNLLQTGGDGMLRKALLLLVAYSSVTLFFWVFHGTARILERSISFDVTRRFRERIYGIVVRLSLRWHREHHSGDTIDRISKSSGALREFSDSSYLYIETIVRFVASLSAILYFMPLYGTIALGLGAGITLVIFRFNKRILQTLRDINAQEHGIAATLHDYVSNMTTIITLHLGEGTARSYADRILSVFPVFRKNIVLNETKWFLVSILLSLTNFSLLSLYLIQHVGAGGVFLVGSLVMLYQYLGRFVDVFLRLSGQMEKLQWSDANLRTADVFFQSEFLHAKLLWNGTEGTDVADVTDVPPAKRTSVPSVPPVPFAWRSLSVRNLHFSYQDDHHGTHHLHDISIDLQRGQRIALVGESGSGKSTLLTLLRGLEEPTAGSLSVDGQAADLRLLSSLTTLIPQQPEIFDDTIGFNITVGAQRTQKDILEACETACFTKVLDRLPEGLATSIRERGVNLSGGECQRLALARGIFSASNSPVLLLDEPTSSMDSVTEQEIYRRIFDRFSDRCIVSSIHRLHLLHQFDVIYVLERGKVIESGSLPALLSKGGKLHEMWGRYGPVEENPRESVQMGSLVMT